MSFDEVTTNYLRYLPFCSSSYNGFTYCRLRRLIKCGRAMNLKSAYIKRIRCGMPQLDVPSPGSVTACLMRNTMGKITARFATTPKHVFWGYAHTGNPLPNYLISEPLYGWTVHCSRNPARNERKLLLACFVIQRFGNSPWIWAPRR